MPGKYTRNEEKVWILAWRQENVPVKVICEHSGKGKATIMRILAAIKELSPYAAPKHKFEGGRRRKTSRYLNHYETRTSKKSLFNGIGSVASSPNLLKNVTICTVQLRLQKNLYFPSHKKNLLSKNLL